MIPEVTLFHCFINECMNLQYVKLHATALSTLTTYDFQYLPLVLLHVVAKQSGLSLARIRFRFAAWDEWTKAAVSQPSSFMPPAFEASAAPASARCTCSSAKATFAPVPHRHCS